MGERSGSVVEYHISERLKVQVKRDVSGDFGRELYIMYMKRLRWIRKAKIYMRLKWISKTKIMYRA